MLKCQSTTTIQIKVSDDVRLQCDASGARSHSTQRSLEQVIRTSKPHKCSSSAFLVAAAGDLLIEESCWAIGV